ncbi:MAG: cyclic nucleotide-binding domain-containing protein [Bacteroidia bacterium]|nr:cyclic nucleotide-binding domain-containing protein [Bacteroidia bacterium]
MLSFKERVDLLKSVYIFSKTPPNVLENIAKLLQEVFYEVGQCIVSEDSHPEGLFIIVRGKVQVKRGNYFIQQLGPGATLGEQALLSAEDHWASVFASEDTVLLCLDRRGFYTQVATRIEVMRAIISLQAAQFRDLSLREIPGEARSKVERMPLFRERNHQLRETNLKLEQQTEAIKAQNEELLWQKKKPGRKNEGKFWSPWSKLPNSTNGSKPTKLP